jgi:hypothetical protein
MTWVDSKRKLSCLSCRWCVWDWAEHTTRCERARPEYPDPCPHFEYEPGTDEGEKNDK